MKIKSINSYICSVFIAFCIFVTGSPQVSAKTNSSNLIIIRKAILGEIQYQTDWLDVNNDSLLDIKDLIRLKKHSAGVETEIKPIKFVDITFVSGDTNTVFRIYKPQYILPDLSKPYNYWKIDNSYYTPNSIYIFNCDTTVIAVENKKDVDFPFIEF